MLKIVIDIDFISFAFLINHELDINDYYLENRLFQLCYANCCLFLIFVTETISRTDESQPRPKYIFNKCGINIYFVYSTEVWSITITEF